MKILTVAATSFFANRGSHIRIYNEAKYLQKLGGHVLVCTYHNGKDVENIKTSRIGNVSWFKKTSPGFHLGKIWCDLKLAKLVAKEAKKFKPDVIHAHMFEALGVVWLAGLVFGLKIKRKPVVLDLQGDLKNEFENYNKKNKLAKNIFVAISKWLIKKANTIVASSERAKKEIERNNNLNNSISVVADGVDLDLYQEKSSTGDNKEIEKIKKWKGNDKILIYAGGMEDSKGARELLKAFTDKRPNDWELIMFGTGSEKNRYVRRYVRRYVHFCETSNYFSLPNFLSLADVAIDPKNDNTESSGKLPIYMAANLPIVCFDNEFNRKLLGEEGKYLKNWEGLSKTLSSLPEGSKVDYTLEDLSEEKEAEKLFEIMKKIA